MKKQLQLFLLSSDEAALTKLLLEQRPGLQFLDDNVWSSHAPAVATSIDRCSSPFVYLWDRSIVDPLPTMRRQDGQLVGPASGVVIQLIRSRFSGDSLLSGRIAVGIGTDDSERDSKMTSLAKETWKIVKSFTSNHLSAVDPTSGAVVRLDVVEYRAGPNAIRWVSESPSHFLKDRSTQNFFRLRLQAAGLTESL